jgi:hypothetical protein
MVHQVAKPPKGRDFQVRLVAIEPVSARQRLLVSGRVSLVAEFLDLA